MPIEIISSQDAFSKLDKFSRWPHPGKDGDRYTPLPSVNHTPGFSISSQDKLFTIGSCFARNVERALIALGLPVLSSIIDGTGPGENITNKYTTRTILHDLRVAFEGADPLSTIHQNGSGNAVNLTFGGKGADKAAPIEELLQKTNHYYNTMRRLRETDIVVLTLGLVETWYDKKAGVYINLAPPLRLAKQDPGRFELHVLSFDDIHSDVAEILRILRRECRSGVRFLVTVSPVPLAATFRGQDVLQANAYSKAVQRAAIETVVLKNNDVTYFPSFEMVTLSPPKQAWVDDDYRHVRPETVDRIMHLVISKYVNPATLAPGKHELLSLRKAKDWRGIVDRVEQFSRTSRKEISAQPPHLRWYYAKSLTELGRIDEALPFLRRIVSECPGHTAAMKLLDRLGT
jgi:hypothetical protein